MCLDMRFKPEVEKKMIAKLPDGLITVYRMVTKHEGHYHPLFNPGRFRVGLNRANTRGSITICRGGSKYHAGYQSFTTLEDLRKWRDLRDFPERRFVKFQIRKVWITAIGRQKHLGNSLLVYVTDRIISPSLRDKSAVLEQA